MTEIEKNAESPAFAAVSKSYNKEGLTKREYFAAMAMQAFASNPSWAESMIGVDNFNEYTKRLTNGAVKLADALLAELENKKNKYN